MKINFERFYRNLFEIGCIGKDDNGGISRLAYSKEYFMARDLLVEKFKKAGLETYIDEVGNLFGVRPGTNSTKKSIMIGSHLDTVNNGGIYDGNLGIIAALECIETFNDNNVLTEHPLEIAAFIAEEGAVLGGTFGSRVMTGREFPNDKQFNKKLSKCGITRENILNSKRNTELIACFIELHIEQGGILENQNIPIGIVDGIVGIDRYEILVYGQANHAGTTPMLMRKDALTATAKLLIKIDQIVKKIGPPLVATVGSLNVLPGDPCVVPGEVIASLELRDLEQSRINNAEKKIFDYSRTIENADIVINKLVSKPPVKLDSAIGTIIEEVCIDSKIPFKHMPSGAGHDAKEIAFHVPTAMIFVPSKDGISHSPLEETSNMDLHTGTQILLDSILRIDSKIKNKGDINENINN